MTTSATSREALSLVVALHRLVRSLRHTSKTAGLQPTQLVVLSQLMESGPMRIGELAVRVPCSQPTATTVVTSLESAGLVRREPDPADGRATRVLITDEGRNTIISVAHGEAELLSERMARLPDAERAALADLAPVLHHLAETPTRAS